MTDPDRLLEFMCGNKSAAAFVSAVHEVVEIWDDLIDRDKPVTPEKINRAFYLLFVTIPRNRFYGENFSELNPIIDSAVIDWFAANSFESNRKNLETAFTLRCSIQNVCIMAAKIIGGPELATKVNIELRSGGETFAEYVKSLGDK